MSNTDNHETELSENIAAQTDEAEIEPLKSDGELFYTDEFKTQPIDAAYKYRTPFWTLVKKFLLGGFSIIIMTFLYFIYLMMISNEFLGEGRIFTFSLLTNFTTVFIYSCAVLYVFIIIKVLKNRDYVRILSTYKICAVLLMCIGITWLLFVISPPIRILFIGLTVLAGFLTFLLMRRLNEKEQTLTIPFVILLFAQLVFIVLMRAVFSVIIYNGMGMSVTYVYTQEKPGLLMTDEYNYSIIEEFTREDPDIEFYPMILSIEAFSTRKGFDLMLEEELKNYDVSYYYEPERSCYKRIADSLYKTLREVGKKYDDKFFETNYLLIYPIEYTNIERIDISRVYDIPSMDKTIIDGELLSYDDEEQCCGVCYVLISFPKFMRGVFNHSNIIEHVY